MDGMYEGYADLAAHSGYVQCAECSEWKHTSDMVVIDNYYYCVGTCADTQPVQTTGPRVDPDAEAIMDAEWQAEQEGDPAEGWMADSYHGQYDDDPNPYHGDYSEE